MSKELPSSFKLLTIWLLILTAVFLAAQAWQHQRERPRFTLNERELRLQRGPDGHFHWPGHLGGQETVFLVDTGATTTALPRALAERLGLRPLATLRSSTAGGVVEGYAAEVDLSLEGGLKAPRLRVVVLPTLDAPLLGMDVLGRLKFSQQAGEFTVELQR
ncbi:retropepsin-like aspartic protease family protein [Roseateles sp. DB2]|uniref:retropepsin-like aspartic protease family protein n=1 Tax=Roseateles sp. DB2 TaxID=3453717 RepID=UPI003EECE072